MRIKELLEGIKSEVNRTIEELGIHEEDKERYRKKFMDSEVFINLDEFKFFRVTGIHFHEEYDEPFIDFTISEITGVERLIP